jgi:hypothetical protein
LSHAQHALLLNTIKRSGGKLPPLDWQPLTLCRALVELKARG